MKMMWAISVSLGILSCTCSVSSYVIQSTNTLGRFSQIEPSKMPDWNFANASTPDATSDGRSGVIIEPDLQVGKPGKDGATVTKVLLGPYRLDSGETRTQPLSNFALPCKDCLITAMQLTCQYKNGREANVDTGAWCHHVDLVAYPGTDYTCPSSFFRTITTAADPAMGGERIFSGGNERTPVRLNSKSKYGLDLGNKRRFGGVWELMNENKKPIDMYFVLLFEHVPKSTSGYKVGRLAWLDVTGCGRESEFPAERGEYAKESIDYVMKNNAEWLFLTGHVHDGGEKVEMFINGKLACTSKQIYANRRGGFVEATDGSILPDSVMPEGSHISDNAVCKNFATSKVGDKVKIKVHYSEKKHMQMRNPDGDLEGQMGIAFGYIGII